LVEVANGGFFGGTSTDAEGLVLEDLEFVNVVFGGVREPNRTGIGGDGAEEGVVGGEEGLLLVAPFGASQTFKDSEAGGNFRGNGGDMGTEIEKGVKGNSKDFRGFLKGKGGAVDLDLRMEVGLVLAVRSEEGDSGFVGSYGEAVGGGPVSD
jgi:hypothetical protein